MSLMERVRLAGNDEASSPFFGEAAMGDLRRLVQDRLPPDRMALVAASNPLQAENEMRLACQRAFEENPWLAEGQAAREQMTSRLIDDVMGLGPLEPLLADAAVTEIMVNGCASLYVEREGRLERENLVFSSDEQVRALIDRIIGPLGRRIDESSPMVDARLAQGHRVHAVIPPVSLDGPVLTIRKFTEHVMSLQEMEGLGSLDAETCGFLRQAVERRANIAVSGGTGSGKTTLLNALSCCIPHSERIVTIEDSAELRFLEHPHVVRMEARERNAEGTGRISIRDLVRTSLRMRPDRIIVGECRGEEALDMLQAMNTGHDGSLTTLHANTPADAVMRLSMMVRFGAELPIDVIEAQIGSAIDYIVQTERDRLGRRFVSCIAKVSFDRDARRCAVRTLFRRKRFSDAGTWEASSSGALGLAGSAEEARAEDEAGEGLAA